MAFGFQTRIMHAKMKKSPHMSCSNSGGSHNVPVVVKHIDTLGQLIVSHQAHVTDVCTSWKGRGRQLRNYNAF